MALPRSYQIEIESIITGGISSDSPDGSYGRTTSELAPSLATAVQSNVSTHCII